MITYQSFMLGTRLRRSSFPANTCTDHEHCTMCGAKFSAEPKDLQEGYVDVEGNHWVCFECMRDYKDEYGWSVES